MLYKKIDNRFKAALTHLGLSALIASTVVLCIILVWYPGPTMSATGATKVFFIVLGVDVCLGPLLTLIVFDKKKPELARDLTIILIIQIAALCYGLYTVTVARPAYYVFAIDRFELVQANEITKSNLNKVTNKEFKSLPLFKAQWVAALLPDTPEEKNDLLFAAVDGGADLAQSPQYYHDYNDSLSEVIKRAHPLRILKEYNTEGNSNKIEALLSQYPHGQYGYLPMSARKHDLAVIIDLTNGQPIDIINIKPW